MTLRRSRWLRLLAWGAVATMMLAAPAHAQPRPQAGAALFEAWAGPWAGEGTLTTADGTRTRIRCLVTYVVQDRGYAVRLDLRCASDAYRFEITSDIAQSGPSLSGNWFESTRRVGGKITGRAAGSELNIRAEGDTFTALVTLTTQGNRQTFRLESPRQSALRSRDHAQSQLAVSGLVSRFRSSPEFAARFEANFGIEGH